MRKTAPDDDLALPIKLDSTSNGEYWPRPPSAALRHATASALEATTRNARRLGMTRREYLASCCGAATVFLALNGLGCGGGRYRVREEAALDPEAARAALGGEEFIFDVQTHQVSAERVWWDAEGPSLASFLSRNPRADLAMTRIHERLPG